jgi:hypothetical protein
MRVNLLKKSGYALIDERIRKRGRRREVMA